MNPCIRDTVVAAKHSTIHNVWDSATPKELCVQPWLGHTVGMAGGLRASGPKADLALIVADADAVAAGVFTTNVMCAAPVLYCKQVLAKNKPARAVSRPLQP